MSSDARRDSFNWLLAESWWAESLRAPDLGELARWVFTRAPWGVLLHFGARIGRAWHLLTARPAAIWKLPHKYILHPDVRRGWKELLTFSALLPVAVGVQAILQCLLLLLLLLSALPIPALRSPIRFMQKKLGEFVGDSYIFLVSPIQEASAVCQVQRDLAWLAHHCKRVAIVAHSQGAAITYRALEGLRLQKSWPDELDLFISFGSGIRKLFGLKHAGERSVIWSTVGWTTLAIAVAFWGAVIALAVAAGDASSGVYVALGIGALICLFLLSLAGWIAVVLVEKQPQPRTFGGKKLKWVDYYASQDPVPGGPMLNDTDPWRSATKLIGRYLSKMPEDADLPKTWRDLLDLVDESDDLNQKYMEKHWLHSLEVQNLSSVLRDHTTDWSNMDEFVTRVIRMIARCSNALRGQVLIDGQSSRLAIQRRRWRVRLLTWMQRIAVVSTLIPIVGHRQMLGEKTSGIVEGLESMVTRLPPGLLGGSSGLTKLLERVKSQDPVVLGVAGLVLGILIIYRLAFLGWRVWERSEFDCLWSGSEYRLRNLGFVLFGMVGLALLGASYWGLYSLLSQALTWGGVRYWLLAPSVLIVWLAFYVVKNAPTRGREPQPRETSDD